MSIDSIDGYTKRYSFTIYYHTTYHIWLCLEDLHPYLFPPRGAFVITPSIACHFQSIPVFLSYTDKPSIHIRLNTPADLNSTGSVGTITFHLTTRQVDSEIAVDIMTFNRTLHGKHLTGATNGYGCSIGYSCQVVLCYNQQYVRNFLWQPSTGCAILNSTMAYWSNTVCRYSKWWLIHWPNNGIRHQKVIKPQ